MKCPIDGAELVIAERSGIEIDYCPKCRGVWLDRGELDKIIERAAQPVGLAEPAGRMPVQPAPRQPEPPAYAQDRRHEEPRRRKHDDDDDDDDRYRGGDRGYRKKRSFLDDIFDF